MLFIMIDNFAKSEKHVHLIGYMLPIKQCPYSQILHPSFTFIPPNALLVSQKDTYLRNIFTLKTTDRYNK